MDCDESSLIIGGIIVIYFLPFILIYCFFTPAGWFALYILWITAIGLIVGTGITLIMGFITNKNK